jgi:tetratricopeptide (TPR) repeat protein
MVYTTHHPHSRRLTKEEIKKDALRTKAEQIVDFAEAHVNQILIATGIVIILLGAIGLYAYQANQDKINASLAMQHALKIYKEAEETWSNQEKSKESSEKFRAARMAFDDIWENHNVGLYASSALFYSAKISYQLGNYDEAVEKYRRLIKEHSKTVFALYAQNAIGLCYEQKGGAENLKKARAEFEAEKYRTFSQLPEYQYVLLEAHFNKGRCYEKLQDQKNAIQAYKYISDQFKNNLESAIKSKREKLLTEAKEVAKSFKKDENILDPTIRKSYEDGIKSEKAGKLDEALESYHSAIRLYGNLKQSRGTIGTSGNNGDEDSTLLAKIDRYIKSADEFIKNLKEAKKLEAQDQFNSAIFAYKRAVDFDFPPSQEVLENAQFHLDKLSAISSQP